MGTLAMRVTGKLPARTIKQQVGIRDKYDAFHAQVLFNLGQIIEMDEAIRPRICRELIKQSKRVKVAPLHLWLDVLRNPTLYNQLAVSYERGHLQ